MERFKMDKLVDRMKLTIRGLKKGVRRLKMKLRRGMYAFCFTAIKRLAGAGNVIAPNVIRIPNNMGHVFNCTWDKTLRMGTHWFGFLCVKDKEPWCAHCILDDWVEDAKSFGLPFQEGLLFPKLDPYGKIKHGLRWVAKDLTETLKRDLERYNLYQGETPTFLQTWRYCRQPKEREIIERYNVFGLHEEQKYSSHLFQRTEGVAS